MARGGKSTPGGMPAQSTSPGPSQEYGQGVANQQAMKAVPLPKLNAPPTPPQLNTPGAMPSAQPNPMGPGPQGSMQDQAPMPIPGSLGGLTDPSTSSNPITHGASFGPGLDLSQLPVNPKPSPPLTPQIDAAFMVNYLPLLESRASQPDSSFALRAWVRRLRSALPPDFDPTHLQTAKPSIDQRVGTPSAAATVPADPNLHTAPAQPTGGQ